MRQRPTNVDGLSVHCFALPSDEELTLRRMLVVGPVCAVELSSALGYPARRASVEQAAELLEGLARANHAEVWESFPGRFAARYSVTSYGQARLVELQDARRAVNFPDGQQTEAPVKGAPDCITVEVAAQLANRTRKGLLGDMARAGIELVEATEGASVDRAQFLAWWLKRTESVKEATEAARGEDKPISKRQQAAAVRGHRRRKRRAARTKHVEVVRVPSLPTPLVEEAQSPAPDAWVGELGARVDQLAERITAMMENHRGAAAKVQGPLPPRAGARADRELPREVLVSSPAREGDGTGLQFVDVGQPVDAPAGV